jgi:hypothetical protein
MVDAIPCGCPPRLTRGPRPRLEAGRDRGPCYPDGRSQPTGGPRLAAHPAGKRPREQSVPEQFLVLITCHDEKHQVELFDRFQGEGLECQALLS